MYHLFQGPFFLERLLYETYLYYISVMIVIYASESSCIWTHNASLFSLS